MLFRRIEQHVRDQNWFAVAIDFAIVVIGVFVGLQVANWNEGRAEDRRERAYLERLDAEFDVVEIRSTRLLETSETARTAIADLLRAQYAGPSTFADMDGQDVADLLASTISGIVPATPPPAFEELVNSGNLSILGNDELRATLYEFEAISEVARLSWENNAGDMHALRRHIFSTVEFDPEATAETLLSGEAAYYAVLADDSFYDNAAFRTSLKEALVLIRNDAGLVQQQKDLVERIETLIAEELAR